MAQWDLDLGKKLKQKQIIAESKYKESMQIMLNKGKSNSSIEIQYIFEFNKSPLRFFFDISQAHWTEWQTTYDVEGLLVGPPSNGHLAAM